MNRKVELLAPAGNKDAFIGAINAGANAVYLAGKKFGARKFAKNFTLEEIKEMIAYAHKRYVQVFVTVNTLVYEEELQNFLSYTDALVTYKVDALIVQDLGLLEVLVARYPDTEIHASTQTNVSTVEQLKYYKDLGVKRVILARETSLEDIRLMRKEVDIDLEVFVHGALCMSYSGNCYFSMLSGGRSGNRGECAQPCRLPYQLYRNKELRSETCYLLSTKDLMTLPNLREIIKSGVVSLKIEGRMRRSEYVVHTVKTYKEAIDAYYIGKDYDPKEPINHLAYMFNRHFTKGYILNEEAKNINYQTRPNHQGLVVGEVLSFNRGKAKIRLIKDLSIGDGYRIIGQKDIGGKVDRILYKDQPVKTAKKGMEITLDLLYPVQVGDLLHKTLDKGLDEDTRDYMDETYKLIPISLELEAFVGHKLKTTVTLPDDEVLSLESNYVIEGARKQGQSKGEILKQFLGFGSSFYHVQEVKIETDEKGFIPNKIIKTLRRELVKLMGEATSNRDKPRIVKSFLTISKPVSTKEMISVKVEKADQYDLVKGKVEQIYYTKNLASRANEEDVLFSDRHRLESSSVKKMVVHDLRVFTSKNTFIASPYMNTSNSYSVLSLLKQGFEKVTLSFELTVDQMIDLVQKFKESHKFVPNVEVVVYGKMDAMLSKYCPIQKVEGTSRNCNLCERFQYDLRNQSGESFKIKRDADCHVRILHHKPLNLLKDIDKLKRAGIHHFACYFTDESKEEVENIVGIVKKNLKGNK